MSRLKILVTMPKNIVFYTFFNEENIAQLEQLGEVIWNESDSKQFTAEELTEKLRYIDIMITGWGTLKIEEEMLQYADKLKLICHSAGTVKPYISNAVYERGIRVTSGNNVFAESVAESVLAYALAALRNITKYSTELKAGVWPKDYYNRGLLNKKIGIVGFGMIAKYVANMLQPFHPELYVFSKNLSEKDVIEYDMKQVSLEEMFETCDIITIHLSNTAETYHMIDENLISRMKDGAYLINTARGAIIDEQALVRVLQQRKEVHAVLDVYEVEPLPANHPLMKLDNAFIMPHMGGPTVDLREVVIDQIIQEINNFIVGEELICEISYEYAQTMTG